jgi:asparagine synthase (glutamine-hydrolysing)
MLFPQWSNMFETGDPGVTHLPVEVRYPFLDLRIVHYLLAIPAFPWTYKKRLLRESMKKNLPEALRIRPKTPLSADPVAAKILDQGKEWIKKTSLSARVREFVTAPKSGAFCDTIDVEKFRAYCLDMWLKTVE